MSVVFLMDMLGAICGVWIDNYYVSGTLMVFGGVVGFVLCPKAEKKSLEEINELKGEENGK
jgi:hypothetical protein